MAEYLSLSGLFEAGGITLLVLIVCSIVSFIVIVERVMYFLSKDKDGQSISAGFLELGRDAEPAQDLLGTPVGYVLSECRRAIREGADGVAFEEVKSRAIAEKLPEMERYLAIEATLGTVSPYIGLLGTVFGIIQAFTGLGSSTDPALVNELNAGIAKALIATAAGLFVAIPATVAYNYFRRRVERMVLAIEVAASRYKVGSKLS